MNTELKLYQIADELLEVINNVADDGCIDGEAFDKLTLAFDQKTEGIVYLHNTFLGQVDILDKEIERLTAMKKARKNSIDGFKNYLSYTMKKLDYKELTVGLHKLSFRKSESLEITDESKIPAKFKTVTTTISKVELKKAIKEGEQIEGYTITEKDNLQIK